MKVGSLSRQYSRRFSDTTLWILPSIDTQDLEALVLGYFIRIDLQCGPYNCFDRGTRIRSHYLIISLSQSFLAIHIHSNFTGSEGPGGKSGSPKAAPRSEFTKLEQSQGKCIALCLNGRATALPRHRSITLWEGALQIICAKEVSF